jgi:hypothetical protein
LDGGAIVLNEIEAGAVLENCCALISQINARLRASRRRQIVKKPKWLRWESSDTKSDDLKKARRQTHRRMKWDAQKAQRDEAENKNRSPSIGSARNRPARQGRRRRIWDWDGATAG